MIKYTPLDKESEVVHVRIDEGEFNGVVFCIHKVDFPEEEVLETEENPHVTIHFDVLSTPESLEMTAEQVESSSEFQELVKTFVSELIEDFCKDYGVYKTNSK